MIIPSNRNDLSRDEQNQIFGGGMMKKFLHQQFDSPYFLDGIFSKTRTFTIQKTSLRGWGQTATGQHVRAEQVQVGETADRAAGEEYALAAQVRKGTQGQEQQHLRKRNPGQSHQSAGQTVRGWKYV